MTVRDRGDPLRRGSAGGNVVWIRMAQISDEIYRKAAQVLGYEFHNPQLLAEALTHASVAEHRLSSNERMEFLGDAVLAMVVCEHLYHLFPHEMEGELTKVKSAVVSRRVCAEVSQKLALTELMSMGKGMHDRAALPSSLAAAVFESLIAAIYLDGGMEPARRFIMSHFAPIIEQTAATSHQHNYKSVLQQHVQQQMGLLPTYKLLGQTGPDHSKWFEVAVAINGRTYPAASGPNKKEAEQRAALVVLRELKLIEDEPG